MTRSRRVRRVGWRLVLAFGVLYSVVHFVVSGIQRPLGTPNLGQMMEEGVAVEAYHAHGRPVEITNPRQYGPIFFFVMDGLLRVCGGDRVRLSHWLYGIQLLAFLLAFVCTVLSMRLWLKRRAAEGLGAQPPLWQLALLLGLLWLNFAPAYYIISIKNVEMWELGLLAAGLYAYLRGWRFLAGLFVAAAALTKMLPLIFLLYFLVRDRRLFASCCVSLLMILTVSHLLYGPQMGYLYLPFMLNASVGHTWSLTWHENVSVKGMLVKLFGHWRLPPGAYSTDITPQGLFLANLLAHGVQIVGLAWMVWVFAKRQVARRSLWEAHRVPWDWAFTIIMLFILAPHSAHDYMVLTLMAFSPVLALLAADPALRADRWVMTCFGAATLLIANVLPRQLINRMLPIEWLNRATGNTHLTLSEGYQYYGLPLLGLLFMVTVLWLIRSRLISPVSGVAEPVVVPPIAQREVMV